MTWLRLDDALFESPEWIRALRDGGPMVLQVWLRLACWCNRQHTDGLVPAEMVTDLTKLRRKAQRERVMAALLSNGLLDPTEDGHLRVAGVAWDPPEGRRVPSRKAIGDGLRYRILARDGFRCRYCGAEAPGVTLVVDHVHPVSAGGTNEPSNLVAACQTCNGGKGALVLVSSESA